MKSRYVETIALVERVQRQCLEKLKLELESCGIRDLNGVQALILYHLGDEELTVGDLCQRGYYLGSNVSYNVKKMTEHGYILQHPSPHDGRSTYLTASPKGKEVRACADAFFDRQAEELHRMGLGPSEMAQLTLTLSRLSETVKSAASRAA